MSAHSQTTDTEDGSTTRTLDTSAPFVLIISGLSGSGKSVALKTLEDLGYDCVDNLPIELLPGFVRSLMHGQALPQRIAVGIDVRHRHSDLSQLPQWRTRVAELGLQARLLFLDACDEVLLRRFADTRRRHPLSLTGLSLPEAIHRERARLLPLQQQADILLDTGALNVHQLRRRIVGEFAFDSRHVAPSLLFESFAYKHGVPADADFVFDARVLPNPHWQDPLRPLTGRDAPVRQWLDNQEEVTRYASQVQVFLSTWLPHLREQTRSYVTVAFGCTGGKHRSVYLAERTAAHIRQQGWEQVATFHRELD